MTIKSETKKLLNFIGWSLAAWGAYQLAKGDKPQEIVKDIVEAPAKVVDTTAKIVKDVLKPMSFQEYKKKHKKELWKW